jgi:glycosyltransferase involved in cell wall biosynthesis
VAALVGDGHEVDVICLQRDGEPARERIGAVSIRRIAIPHARRGVARYALEYLAFTIAAGTLLTVRHLRRRYDMVQVTSPPDCLVFAGLIPRLMGVPVLLQAQEVMPEFFATKFGVASRHPGVRLVSLVEQLSLRFATFTITCTEQMRGAMVSRGADRDKIGVVLLAADENEFDVRKYPPRPREPSRFVLVSHGTVEERYGIDTIIRAIALLQHEVPGLVLNIFGDGSYLPALHALADQLGVADRVHFADGWVPLDQLLRGIADADAGVVAMKRDAFRDLTHNVKMFDFIAMRRPAIVSRTRSVDAYFDDGCFRKFDSDDPADLARAIRSLVRDPLLGIRLVNRATEVAEPLRWTHQRDQFLEVVRRLLGRQEWDATPSAPQGPRRDARPL